MRQLASRSFFHTVARQFSHMVHSPSVFTRRASGGVGWSIRFFSRLNHAIVVESSSVASVQSSGTGFSLGKLPFARKVPQTEVSAAEGGRRPESTLLPREWMSQGPHPQFRA